MSERGIVDFVEDWQTGFFVLVASGVLGLLVAVLVEPYVGPPGALLGAFAGVVFGFLAYSYLRYGR